MSDSYRINRKFERLLFRGVPERPEPNYERTLNADANDRYTGKSQLNSNYIDLNSDDVTVFAEIKYLSEEGKVLVNRL